MFSVWNLLSIAVLEFVAVLRVCIRVETFIVTKDLVYFCDLLLLFCIPVKSCYFTAGN